MTEAVAPPVLDVLDDEENRDAQVDYFGVDERHRFDLPDGKSWIEFKVLNEGEKSEWEKSTQGDVVFERNSGNARMRPNSADARHKLITLAVTDWNLKRRDKQTGRMEQVSIAHGLRDWLRYTNPKLVVDLEAAIRKQNPFLIVDLTIEEIDKQIEELQEQRKLLVERQQGE
jgi:hypothetical protein